MNRSCALMHGSCLPVSEIRETLYILVKRTVKRPIRHEQVERIVEGFISAWGLA